MSWNLFPLLYWAMFAENVLLIYLSCETWSSTLHLPPLFVVMVCESFCRRKITFLTWLLLDELFHISLTYRTFVKVNLHRWRWRKTHSEKMNSSLLFEVRRCGAPLKVHFKLHRLSVWQHMWMHTSRASPLIFSVFKYGPSLIEQKQLWRTVLN